MQNWEVVRYRDKSYQLVEGLGAAGESQIPSWQSWS